MDRNSIFDKAVSRLTDYFKDIPIIISAYIFGSFGTERQTLMSDLDIAVLFAENIPLMDELKYAAEVSSLLKIEKIDFINLNNAPVHLQHEILSKGIRIFDRVPERTQDFIENMLEIYHDYQGILKKYHEDLHKGLLEDYMNG